MDLARLIHAEYGKDSAVHLMLANTYLGQGIVVSRQELAS